MLNLNNRVGRRVNSKLYQFKENVISFVYFQANKLIDKKGQNKVLKKCQFLLKI